MKTYPGNLSFVDLIILALVAFLFNGIPSTGVWLGRKDVLPSNPWQLFNISIRANTNKTEGLFPNVFNLASMAEITSNATCGQKDPEQFCKLVEHVKRRPGDKIQCGVCFANSSHPQDNHPISNAIDGTHRWWQSPSIANGWNYNWVTITLDLKQVYQVAYVIIKAANSPRPGNWILEKSTNGIDYMAWQYFALSNSDCWNTYKKSPTVGVPRFKRDNEVICTSLFSLLDPLENGEIHISLVNGRPGVAGPSKELIEFTAARYIRLRLQRIRTLNADLMLPFHYNLQHLDSTVTNRYYYSIKDISVGGQCICYGHARDCSVDPVSRELQCKCEGNTCGRNCEMCCPLFNQIPWRQGTYTEGAVCEECNCFGHSYSCVYNKTVAAQKLSLSIDGMYEGGGVCIDCKHNTMGVNCELCADGFFLPSGLDHNLPDTCHLCLCDEIGATGLCVKDDSDEDLGLNAGDCICREGYCGQRCDQCSPGYTGYPICKRCPCSPIGSTNEDLCAKCTCKENVCGENCDECLPGFYNLRAENRNGCDQCFCFSVSDECHSSTWGREIRRVMSGWYITDSMLTEKVLPIRVFFSNDEQSLHFSNQKTRNLNHDLYWLAPAEYIGNKVSSYDGILEFSFNYSVDCSMLEKHPDSYVANSDVILEGNGMRLGFGGDEFNEEMQHVVEIKMAEPGWIHLENSTSPQGMLVSRDEFFILLSYVDHLLIRASYNVYQTEMNLLWVDLDVASEFGTGLRMTGVEMCNCPEGYSGTSCESCSPGYRRIGNMLVGGICATCECNGHSDTCDPYTGECQNCLHNTRGAHCESCAIGYHGDALLSLADGCKRCACPLESNSFAESCVVINREDGKGQDHVCLRCRPGHDGKHCETCISGFYGNPLQPGNYCQPCDCNQNVAADQSEDCDPVSGQCYRCTGYTEGFHCDRCQEGYYGTAIDGDCKECMCSIYGSLDAVCDRITGQCLCRHGFAGRDCGQCQDGHTDVESGCLLCKCNQEGSEKGSVCDPVSGRCRCKSGVGGKQCSQCLPYFYALSPSGCQACACHALGSNNLSCDALTGQCNCRDNVIGWSCDRCIDDYWGLNSGAGCQPCQCNTTGSLSAFCAADTGVCSCKPGISGRRCDQCMGNHFDFSGHGCRRCEKCKFPGHVCHPVSGKCVCPPHTEGITCDRCFPNSWGHDPVRGCQPCHCDAFGSLSDRCNPVNGQCLCKIDYAGLNCDQCPFGYYNFPSCIPCQCDVQGTRSNHCKGGQCSCNDVTGQCLCKENIFGRTCDRCENDECTEALISSLDDIINSMNEFNSSAVALLPWARMNNAEYIANLFQKHLKSLNAIYLKEITFNTSTLSIQAKRLMLKVEELKIIAEMEEKDAADTKTEADEVLNSINKLYDHIRGLVADIFQPLHMSKHDLSNVTSWLKEAEILFRDIQSVDFMNVDRKAAQELELSESLLNKVLQVVGPRDNHLDSVQKYKDDIVSRLRDLHSVYNIIREQMSNTTSTNRHLSRMLDKIRETTREIDEKMLSAHNICQSAVHTNDVSSHFLWNVSNENYQAGLEMLQEFRIKNEDMENIVKRLEEALPALNKLAMAAIKHAKELEKQSYNLEQQFSSTRHLVENPLEAASVYEKTKKTIEEAETSVLAASIAATDAFEKIIQRDLENESKYSLNKSKEIYENASDLMATVSNEMGQRLEEAVDLLDETFENNDAIKDNLLDFNVALNATPESLREVVHEISYETAVSLDKSNKIEKNVMGKIRHIETEFVPKMNDMKGLTEDGFAKLNASVILAVSQIDELVNRSQSLYEKKDRIHQLGSNIEQNILKLKRMIEEARAQAASIKISMYHQGECIRKYAVPNRSSLFNSITLHFKTNATDVDQLLFLLRNRNNSDFLALEMVDRKVRFVWNVGDITAVVEHKLQIESDESKSDEKDMWYRVHAQRIGNVGKLNVHKLSSVSGEEVETTAPPGYVRLNIVEEMDLFIAGLPSDYEMPDGLLSTSFVGCIGDVQMDGQTIGLYNFRSLIQDRDCQGCFTVPVIDVFESLVYQFDGSGYASIPQVRYSPERLSVSFQLKVFWKDAILFYTDSNTTGDFVSIELRNGHVVFRFGFMGRTEAELSTQLTYNTNEWIKLKASRTRLEGVLEVDTERITGSSADFGMDTMDLSSSLLYFAGLPRNVPTQIPNITRRGFLGCLRETMVASRGTYTQDFMEGIHTGMSLGCHAKKSHLIGLPGSGHIELGSPNIPNEGGFSISFRTQQEDALILLAMGTKQDQYYSLSITNGRVSAWLNAGFGASQITSDKRYNDGLIHSIMVHKDHKLVEMFIDNQLIGTTSLPSNRTSINSMRGSVGGLYVGGIPFGLTATGMSASLSPFRGCLMDLLINDQALPFDVFVAFKSIDVGRCIEADLFRNLTDVSDLKKSTTPTIPSFTVTVTVPYSSVTPTIKMTTGSSDKQIVPTRPAREPTICAEEADYSYISNAVSFGDIRHSNAEIELERYSNETFNFSMSIRTYYTKGQIFYIGNKNRMDFVSLHLMNGVLNVVFMGSQNIVKNISSDIPIGDGLWHNLAITKSSKSIDLLIDEADPVMDKMLNQISVISPIYIGGLPKEKKAHSAVLTESFKGCIRNFEVNSHPVDIANSKVIMGVRQCFSKSEPGVHFDGYGYAIFAEKYRIISDLSLSFEFRTTRQNGVLFSISHPTGLPALALEMYDGKIKFTVVNIDNIYSTESETCDHCLCDDHWHSVRADLIRNLVTLKVDSGKLTVSVGSGSDMTLETNHELYIGGFPVYAVPQGATHTSEFFQGCLRNVRINNVLVDWHATDNLIDVHVSGCPLSET